MNPIKELVAAASPFATFNSSEEFITVRTADVARLRAALLNVTDTAETACTHDWGKVSNSEEPSGEWWCRKCKATRIGPAAEPAGGIPTETGIAWQSGLTWPNERKAVTVDGHAWYRHDHPKLATPPQAPAVPAGLSDAARDVLAEREKQRAKWGDDHDDEHGSQKLANEACHFLTSGQQPMSSDWAHKSKVTDREPRRVQMVKGVALGLAAIERMDRAALAASAPGAKDRP